MLREAAVNPIFIAGLIALASLFFALGIWSYYDKKKNRR